MTGFQAWSAQFADVEVTLAQYQGLSSFEQDNWERVARDATKLGVSVEDVAPVPVSALLVNPYASVQPQSALPIPQNDAGFVPVAPVDPAPEADAGKPDLPTVIQPQVLDGTVAEKTEDFPAIK